MNQSREQLIDIANNTLSILKRGYYINSQNKKCTIDGFLKESVEYSECYTPENLEEILDEKIIINRYNTKIELTNETTLEASRRLVVHEEVDKGPNNFMGDFALTLNFASATYPGGGFLNGAKAQEESIARSSGLYPTLISQPQFYKANKKLQSSLYTNHIIISPYVPIFKDDGGNLLDDPYLASIITVPAVNRNSLKGGEELTDGGRCRLVHTTMNYRMTLMLALAHCLSYDTLIMGAWGCGAFGNNPNEISKMFCEQLSSKFMGVFKRIVFAVYDTSEDKYIYKAFASELSNLVKYC